MKFLAILCLLILSSCTPYKFSVDNQSLPDKPSKTIILKVSSKQKQLSDGLKKYLVYLMAQQNIQVNYYDDPNNKDAIRIYADINQSDDRHFTLHQYSYGYTYSEFFNVDRLNLRVKFQLPGVSEPYADIQTTYTSEVTNINKNRGTALIETLPFLFARMSKLVANLYFNLDSKPPKSLEGNWLGVSFLSGLYFKPSKTYNQLTGYVVEWDEKRRKHFNGKISERISAKDTLAPGVFKGQHLVRFISNAPPEWESATYTSVGCILLIRPNTFESGMRIYFKDDPQCPFIR